MIIAFSGHLGSGKDFIADCVSHAIQAQLGVTYERKSFAYKLKHITSILSGFPLIDMFSQDGKNKEIPSFNITVGKMQQLIGTEIFRQWDEQVWIKALFSEYTDSSKWIVTDCRFKNEADYIKEQGGILIRINGDIVKIRENSTRDLTHASEVELDNYDGFDIIFDNDVIGNQKIDKILIPQIINLINKNKESDGKVQ